MVNYTELSFLEFAEEGGILLLDENEYEIYLDNEFYDSYKTLEELNTHFDGIKDLFGDRLTKFQVFETGKKEI